MENNQFRENTDKLKMKNDSFSKGTWIWNMACQIRQSIYSLFVY